MQAFIMALLNNTLVVYKCQNLIPDHNSEVLKTIYKDFQMDMDGLPLFGSCP